MKHEIDLKKYEIYILRLLSSAFITICADLHGNGCISKEIDYV